MEANKNIIEPIIETIIYNIIDNIIDNILTKPICKNCEENETKDINTKYCDWCGYNIYHNKKELDNRF